MSFAIRDDRRRPLPAVNEKNAKWFIAYSWIAQCWIVHETLKHLNIKTRTYNTESQYTCHSQYTVI